MTVQFRRMLSNLPSKLSKRPRYGPHEGPQIQARWGVLLALRQRQWYAGKLALWKNEKSRDLQPLLDCTATFKLLTSRYRAEFGRA